MSHKFLIKFGFLFFCCFSVSQIGNFASSSQLLFDSQNVFDMRKISTSAIFQANSFFKKNENEENFQFLLICMLSAIYLFFWPLRIYRYLSDIQIYIKYISVHIVFVDTKTNVKVHQNETRIKIFQTPTSLKILKQNCEDDTQLYIS